MKKLILILILFVTTCGAQDIKLTPLHDSNFMLADEELSITTYFPTKDTFWVSAYLEKDDYTLNFYGFRIAKNKNIQCLDSVLILKTENDVIKANLIHQDPYNLYFSPDKNVLELLRTQDVIMIEFNGNCYAHFLCDFSSRDYFKRLMSQYKYQLMAYQMLPDTTIKK